MINIVKGFDCDQWIFTMLFFTVVVGVLLACCNAQDSNYIVHGSDVPFVGKWSSICSLQLYSGEHWCGASLIHEDWVITAAHCVIGRPPWEMQVTCGITELGSKTLVSKTSKIEKWIVHEDYEYNYQDWPHDLVVIKLESPMDQKDLRVMPAKLPANDSYNWDWASCYAVGWGRLGKCLNEHDSCESWAESGECDANPNYMLKKCKLACKVCDESMNTFPKQLQEADLTALNYWQCTTMFSIDQINREHICVYDRTGRGHGSCNGDSGGPLYCKREGKYYQVGVFSWMSSTCNSDDFPSIYTRIYKYYDWIEKQIGYGKLVIG